MLYADQEQGCCHLKPEMQPSVLIRHFCNRQILLSWLQ